MGSTLLTFDTIWRLSVDSLLKVRESRFCRSDDLVAVFGMAAVRLLNRSHKSHSSACRKDTIILKTVRKPAWLSPEMKTKSTLLTSALGRWHRAVYEEASSRISIFLVFRRPVLIEWRVYADLHQVTNSRLIPDAYDASRYYHVQIWPIRNYEAWTWLCTYGTMLVLVPTMWRCDVCRI